MTTTTSTTTVQGGAGAGPTPDDELRTKLLTVQDLPPGYTVEPDDSSDDDSSDEEFCTEAFARFDALDDDDTDDIEAQFQKGAPGADGGAFLLEDLGSAEPDVVDKAFDDLPGAFAQCHDFTSTDPDGTTVKGTGTTSGLDLPLDGNIVFVRKDDIVMFVFGFGLGQRTIPTDELTKITHTAYEKL